MNNRHLYILCACLTGLSLLLFLYKAFSLDFPLRPDVSSNAWEVEIKVAFETYDRPVKVELQIPGSRTSLPILNENFISRGFGLTTMRVENERIAIWSKRQPEGAQTLYYRALVEIRKPSRNVSYRRPDMARPGLEGADLIAASAILDEARQKSADLDTLVVQLARRFNDPSPKDEYVPALLGTRTSDKERLEWVVKLLLMSDYPARSLHGVHLSGAAGNAEVVHWLEVFEGDEWRAYDGITGIRSDKADHIILWRGPGRLANLSGGDQLTTEVTKEAVEMGGLSAATSRERLFSPGLWTFSLSSLPLATQNVYKVLLLVPVGAFVILLLRNVVGISTFGTFMPVLIALAFRETHLLAGIVLFTMMVAIGLLIRFYLDRLKLLLVPRLASVLVIVILLMLTVSIICHQLGIESGLSVALFPMVIITMTIERMTIVWEERGPREAISEGAGSLVAATLAYAAMVWGPIAHLITTFPELLLILLSATLLMGRYSGYRLLELRRFRVLAGGGG